jgi:hypothetical protein
MRRRAKVFAFVLAVVALSADQAVSQEPPREDKAGVASKQLPQNEAVTRLLKTQLAATQKAYQAALDTLAVQNIGGLLVQVKGDTKARPDLAYTWSVRWLHAQRDLGETKEQRTAAFVEHQKRMKQLRGTVRTLVGDGSGGILQASDVPAAEWYLAEAELWLLKEQAK